MSEDRRKNPTPRSSGRPAHGAERELIRQAQAGCLAARDTLVAQNTGLVGLTLKQITFWGPGLDRDDLFQEGLLGLYHAIEKFDLERFEVKLCSYAGWWIRQAMVRAIQRTSFTIRLPCHWFGEAASVLMAEEAWEQQHGRKPTLEELAAELALEPEEVQRRRALPLCLEGLTESEPDGAGASDGDQCLSRLRCEASRFEASAERRLWLRQLLAGLGPAYQKTIIRRFGLDGQPVATLQELGDADGVTRERIRQRERTALRQLKSLALADPNAAIYLDERPA